MIATTKCEHCGQAFEIDGLNRTEFCPHCGKETTIIARSSTPRPGPAGRPQAFNAGMVIWPVVLLGLFAAIFLGVIPVFWGAIFICMAILGAIVSQFSRRTS